LNQSDERGRTAIHNRGFGGIDVDKDVVNIQTRQGREDMLNRLDLKSVPADRGTEFGGHEVIHRRRKCRSGMPIPIHKDNACVGGCGTKGEGHRLSGM
jgi:hypothetical protein